MAAGPLNHIVLAAGSVADDLGYIALADISRLLDTAADYRVIGGLMVTALAYRWNLGASICRSSPATSTSPPPQGGAIYSCPRPVTAKPTPAH
jgi:hypothetical protein